MSISRGCNEVLADVKWAAHRCGGSSISRSRSSSSCGSVWCSGGRRKVGAGVPSGKVKYRDVGFAT